MDSEGEKSHSTTTSATCDRYVIHVRRDLDTRWPEWPDGVTVTHEAGGVTRIERSIVDLAAFGGVLNELRKLGLRIIAVQRLGPVRRELSGPMNRREGKENSIEEPFAALKRKETTMIRQVRTWFLVGGLTLAALGSASAQLLGPPGWQAAGAIGVLSPSGYQPGWFPMVSYPPTVLLDYRVPPEVVYVPVTVAAPRPPIELVRTAAVTLRTGTPPMDVRVRPGTVVTWTNEDGSPRTLVLDPTSVSGLNDRASQTSGIIPANASVSLAFNQPGFYRYYLQEKPDEQARVLVER